MQLDILEKYFVTEAEVDTVPNGAVIRERYYEMGDDAWTIRQIGDCDYTGCFLFGPGDSEDEDSWGDFGDEEIVSGGMGDCEYSLKRILQECEEEAKREKERESREIIEAMVALSE